MCPYRWLLWAFLLDCSGNLSQFSVIIVNTWSSSPKCHIKCPISLRRVSNIYLHDCKFFESLKNSKCVIFFLNFYNQCNEFIKGRIVNMLDPFTRCRCCVKIFETHELFVTIIMIFPITSNQIWYCAIKSHPIFIRLWILIPDITYL